MVSPWGNNTEIVGLIASHISNTGCGLSSSEVHLLNTDMNEFNKLSVAIVATFSDEKSFLGVECYALTSIGADKVKSYNNVAPHVECNLDETMHTRLGPWSVGYT